MNKTTIFWDFDGVMANSTPFVFAFWKEALNKAGYEFEMEDYQKTFMEKFPFDYFQTHFPDVADNIYNQYSAHEETHYPSEVLPFEGFVDRFTSLPNSYQHFIVSANLQSVINPWLSTHELKSYFPEVLGRETTGYKNEKIEKILDRHRLSPQNCLFVGDTISDIRHAHAANIEPVAATWGVHSKEQLQSAKPKFICENQPQLFTLLHNAHQ